MFYALGPAFIDVSVNMLTYEIAAGPTTITAIGTVGRVESVADIAVPLLLNAPSTVKRARSKALINLIVPVFTPRVFLMSSTSLYVVGSVWTYGNPSIIALNALSTVKRVRSRALLSQPVIINHVGTTGKAQSRADLIVPTAINAKSEVPRVTSLISLFIPPYTISHHSTVKRVESAAYIRVPTILAARGAVRAGQSTALLVTEFAISGASLVKRAGSVISIDNASLQKKRRRVITVVTDL